MYNLIKRMIANNNFGDMKDFRGKIDLFYLINPPRLTEAEYKEINELLNEKEKEMAEKEKELVKTV